MANKYFEVIAIADMDYNPLYHIIQKLEEIID